MGGLFSSQVATPPLVDAGGFALPFFFLRSRPKPALPCTRFVAPACMASLRSSASCSDSLIHFVLCVLILTLAQPLSCLHSRLPTHSSARLALCVHEPKPNQARATCKTKQAQPALAAKPNEPIVAFAAAAYMASFRNSASSSDFSGGFWGVEESTTAINLTAACAGSVAARGLMFANTHPAPRRYNCAKDGK